MADIGPGYASPGLRWGLLLEDHPGATHDFSLVMGDEILVPEEYGGDGKFCLCTITFPKRDGEAQRAPVHGWKPASSGKADDWNVLCTKTLGRALKRAGYPDHLPDLKALVLWRQREAEIERIRLGADISAPALPPGEVATVDAALEEAAQTEPDATSPDDDDTVDADLVDEDDPGRPFE